NEAPEFGYRDLGFFTDQDVKGKLGGVHSVFDFIIENEIDEVYCSVKEHTNNQIKAFIEFCDVNVTALKFIPDNKELYAKNLHLNYYDLTPILSLRKIPLEDPLNSFVKRSFDVIFSLIIICFVLSWLIPILGLLIKLESKGPIFFKQNRPGIKEKGFGCYKFRSMSLNTRSEDSATRNDPRVTKIGRFIRKTSIDELPQFFNVLFGSMSVVGPRPHLWRQNEMYGKKISKYMVRYFVKPGITGLAQVRGYRGEIETREDIVNRTKYDIFYIENWSLLMDFNIIIQTVMNVFSGEEKAY
ncbi:MAG: exopolysaccharide biosynthesis polyprenyl glycosylphosphotransferase, partial [Bacteroidia bacterium]|nr:exopolysaccharide biosynthesis polyprenyl glycosylphosphotransferase [Bacteroidia bacterium]